MKKIITLLLSLLLVLSLAVPAAAVEYEGIMEVIPINAYADNVVIDGVIEDGEWGEPVYVTTPKDVLKNQNYSWDYWSFNEMPTDQKVEIYVTNDGDALYVACKLIGAAYDAGADSPDMAYDHAHFGFTMAPYTAGTVVPRIIFQGETYEEYGHFVFATVNGQKWTKSGTQGLQALNVDSDDYEISYDAASRTYTYECRAAFSLTGVDIGETCDIVMSFNIGDAHGANGANRYMISLASEQAWASMGAGNFGHSKSYPLVIQVRSTSQMRKDEFVPTQEEKAAVEAMTQSGTIAFDAVADTDVSSGMFMTAAIIVAAIAGAVLLFTVIVLVTRKNRSRKEENRK